MSKYFRHTTPSVYYVTNELRSAFPELKRYNTETIIQRLDDTDLIFLQKERINVPFWIRLTLPFAGVAFILLFVLLPVKFILTGQWHYSWQWLQNWFRALRIA